MTAEMWVSFFGGAAIPSEEVFSKKESKKTAQEHRERKTALLCFQRTGDALPSFFFFFVYPSLHAYLPMYTRRWVYVHMDVPEWILVCVRPYQRIPERR